MVGRKKKRTQPASRKTRTVLVYLELEDVKTLKLSAIDKRVTSSSLLAVAIRQWLARNRSLRGKLVKVPRDEDRQFLATLPELLIKRLSDRANDLDTSSTNLVARAVGEWIKRKGRR
jgi:hypothetical protein